MKPPLERIDLEAVKERFDAFWAREPGCGPLVAISCPRDDRLPADFPVPDTLEGRWTDAEYRRNRALHDARSSAFFGVGFPRAVPNIGPDAFTAFLGAELTFLDDGTTWVVPFVDDLEGWEPELQRGSRWWRVMCELTDALCEAAPGNFLVGTLDMHGGGDALSAARHPDKLALDLYDKPAELRRIMPSLTAIYRDIIGEMMGRISRVQQGSTSWIPAYSRGAFTPLQNDFSGLISPRMFAEFFLDEVRELCGFLENSIYHLDGPIALGNLPHLLAVEELDGVQWVPGAGSGPMSRWVEVCRRVLEAGKCLQIGCPAAEAEHLLGALPHDGLFITTGCPSESEARRLWGRVQEMTTG